MNDQAHRIALDCKGFLDVLPNQVFDKVRDFFASTENFVESIDIDTTAKN